MLFGYSYFGRLDHAVCFKNAFWPGFRNLVLGTAIIFLPSAIFFLIKVPFQELYESLILFPLDIYPDYRKLPFPLPFISYQQFQMEGGSDLDSYVENILDRLYLYFPLIVYVALIMQLVIQYRRNVLSVKSDRFWTNMLILLIGLLFFTKVVVRSVYLHIMPTYVMAIWYFLWFCTIRQKR